MESVDKSSNLQAASTRRSTDTSSPLELRFAFWLPWVVFTVIAYKCSRPLVSKISWMMFVQDDFFYYLRTAQNFAHSGHSTFGGVVHTNGYHPLWFLALSALSVFTVSPGIIMAFLAVTAFLASLITYKCSQRLFENAGIRKLTAIALASAITIYSLRMFFYGMEVTLAIPLMFSVLWLLEKDDFWMEGWKESSILGLLISLMVLSRLDTSIFAGLLLVFGILEPGIRKRIRLPNVIGLSIGLAPLAIYFLMNHHFFGVWLPISGLAKQLKTNLHPTAETWEGLYLNQLPFLIVFLPIPLGILLYPFIAKRIPAIDRIAYPAGILFPLVYFFVLCCKSDWFIWPWYMYAQRPAVCLAFVVFCTFPSVAGFLAKPFVTASLFAGVLIMLAAAQWKIQEAAIYEQAIMIQRFSLAHPGVYAMGDRAGRVGYLLNQPLIQTEGLVMDKTFLGYIQRQTSLREVLDRYHVRYYVGTFNEPDKDCYIEDEPFQAGPEFPRMRGRFCNPTADFESPGERSLIFALSGSRQ